VLLSFGTAILHFNHNRIIFRVLRVNMILRMRICAFLIFTLLFSGCALFETPEPPPAPPPVVLPKLPPAEVPEPLEVDRMEDVPGDRPLPAAATKGAKERFDCKVGKEDLHARIAFEARGGQVKGFSYYSKWKPRTCSIDIQPDDAKLKWRLTPEGATRVHSVDGMFIIHTRPDAYVFEFQDVERMKFCGMMGVINGTITVKREKTRKPQCSVIGVLDLNPKE
jgi:hypothetical protein